MMDILQALDVLNHWLDPSFYDHWQISRKLLLLGLSRPSSMVNSKIFRQLSSQSIQNLIASNEYNKACLINIWFDNPFPLYFWSRSFIIHQDTVCVGARWTSRTLGVMLALPGGWREMHFYEPFRLQYPWTFPLAPYSYLTETPTDLEFLYCWARRYDNMINYHREIEDRQIKMKKIHAELKETSASRIRKSTVFFFNMNESK